jgi:1L-myo-inositol 1-phosphate cytidylyltransferase
MTQCLVIAAGEGSRLRALAESKPLAPVAGTPLIERVVRAAAQGGASSFLVVTGYRAEPLEDFLAGLADRQGLTIETVRNGLSVLAAADRLEDDFLLAMSDHLFEPAIVAALLTRGPGELILAVDRESESPLIDMDDATKVALGAEGRIARIGKSIERWDAIDTGLFRAGPALPAAIRASIEAGGQGSLSEGVQKLADEGRALALDVTGRWWMDVDDPRAHALAEEELKRIGIQSPLSP